VTPERIADHADRAKARLLEQFKGSATLNGLIGALTAEVQVLEQVLWDIRASRAIEAAQGEQLDLLGRIVGLDRGGRTDATYRIWIRAWIRLLKGSGTPEDILSVFAAITQGSTKIVLEEQFPAAFVIRVDSTSIIDPAELAKLAQLAKAGGVRVIVESATSDDPTSFAFDPNGAGFGHAGATSTTTAASGTTQNFLDVADAGSFSLGDTVTIDTAAQQETAVVLTKTATRLTFTANLTKTHALGVTVTVANAASIGGTFAAAF
jgi:hypothetical protein